MIVFAVETSCDETSICIMNSDKKIYSHIVYSQKEHSKFGGVIPELASRSHLQILQKISREALSESKLRINDIDIFCATCGPGLIGGLIVGSVFSKSLAIGCKKPFVPINHLEGHVLSSTFNNKILFPYICFLLTGGHTQIYLVHSINNYELLGETLDDAIGEAFDKTAKLLNLAYPGGPEIEKKAIKGSNYAYKLPEPLSKNKDLNFSFSGIKTAVNLYVKKERKKNISNDMAASFQYTVTNVLEKKLLLTIKLLQDKKIKFTDVCLVGGVAANKYIFNRLEDVVKKKFLKLNLPPKDMLSDNAAMIGWACLQKYSIRPISDYYFKENPRLKIYKNNI
ncbi:tRNA (adenosine(37)-N6)-threonylcarbamoyltransferase complex transferase subunit TsaD [Alphaproteobacteria bacterium]|nr:tRNA (adenosine(37)-N6)-threonylcarbamoyltransferase complex transferase subunit TsaD [Alphaproteobacteria bacterium]